MYTVYVVVENDAQDDLINKRWLVIDHFEQRDAAMARANAMGAHEQEIFGVEPEWLDFDESEGDVF